MADKFKKHPGRETAGSGRAAGRHIGETGRVPDRFRDDDIRMTPFLPRHILSHRRRSARERSRFSSWQERLRSQAGWFVVFAFVERSGREIGSE